MINEKSQNAPKRIMILITVCRESKKKKASRNRVQLTTLKYITLMKKIERKKKSSLVLSLVSNEKGKRKKTPSNDSSKKKFRFEKWEKFYNMI
jgi:hypothetical protein